MLVSLLSCMSFFVNTLRPADCAEVHHESHDPAAPDRPSLVLCHPHVRHHRPGVLQREASPHLPAICRHPRYASPPTNLCCRAESAVHSPHVFLLNISFLFKKCEIIRHKRKSWSRLCGSIYKSFHPLVLTLEMIYYIKQFECISINFGSTISPSAGTSCPEVRLLLAQHQFL